MENLTRAHPPANVAEFHIFFSIKNKALSKQLKNFMISWLTLILWQLCFKDGLTLYYYYLFLWSNKDQLKKISDGRVTK